MTTASPFRTLHVLSHPLLQHKLAILRDHTTPTKIFKELVDEIAMLMAYEATKELPLQQVTVRTPLEESTGMKVRGKKLTLVPILRAGLGMVEGILRLIPSARVGHIGIYRDHDTLEPVDYSFKVPGDTEERDFFVLDPMLATGVLPQTRRRSADPFSLPGRRTRRCASLGVVASGCADLRCVAGSRAQ
jgi:uracil phosphoribosyltransferase